MTLRASIINNSTGNFCRYFKYKSEETDTVIIGGGSVIVIAITRIDLGLNQVQHCKLHAFRTLPHGLFRSPAVGALFTPTSQLEEVILGLTSCTKHTKLVSLRAEIWK